MSHYPSLSRLRQPSSGSASTRRRVASVDSLKVAVSPKDGIMKNASRLENIRSGGITNQLSRSEVTVVCDDSQFEEGPFQDDEDSSSVSTAEIETVSSWLPQKPLTTRVSIKRRHPHEVDASSKVEAVVGSGSCSPSKKAVISEENQYNESVINEPGSVMSACDEVINSAASEAASNGRSTTEPSDRVALRSIVKMCRQLPLFNCFQLCCARGHNEANAEDAVTFYWSPRNDVLAKALQYVEVTGYRLQLFDSFVKHCADEIVVLESALMQMFEEKTRERRVDDFAAVGLTSSCLLSRAATVMQLFAPDAAVPSLFHSLEEMNETSRERNSTTTKSVFPLLQGCSSHSSLSESLLLPFAKQNNSKDVARLLASSLAAPFHCYDARPFMSNDEGSRWLGEQEYVLAAILFSVAFTSQKGSNSSYLLAAFGTEGLFRSPESMRKVIAALSSNSLFADSKSDPLLQLAEQLILTHPIVKVAVQVLKGIDHWGDFHTFSESWVVQVRLMFCSSCLRHNHVLRFKSDDSESGKVFQSENVISPVSTGTSGPKSLYTLGALFSTVVPAPDAVSLFMAAHIPDPSKPTTPQPNSFARLSLLTALRQLQQGFTQRLSGGEPVLSTDFDCGASSNNIKRTPDGVFSLWLEGDRGGDEKKVWFRFALLASGRPVCDTQDSASGSMCTLVSSSSESTPITWGQRIPFEIKNIAPHSRLYKSGMRPSFRIGFEQVGGLDDSRCDKSGGEYKGSHCPHRWTLTDSAQFVQTDSPLKEGELSFVVALPPAPNWTSLLNLETTGSHACRWCRTVLVTLPPTKRGQPSNHGCARCRSLRLLLSQQTLQHTVVSSEGAITVSTSPLLRPTLHVSFCDPYSYGDLLSHITLWHSMVKRATSGIRFEERVLCRSVDGRKLHLLIITSLMDQSSKQALQDSLEAGRKPTGPVGAGGIANTSAMSSAVAGAIAGQGFYNAVQSAPYTSFSKGKRVVLISGRVHPSEVTASHAVHGIVQFLLSADPRAALLRDNFIFFIVPMLNPDGVCRGHSRLDQHGFNLNRCYSAPSAETQPTVLALKNVFDHLQQQHKDQFIAYFDFHSHASQLYGFAFGNCLTGPNQSWNMFLPKLIEVQSSGLFDFGTCKFGKNHMSQKDGTSRVLFGGTNGLVHSYTVELSHYAHLVIKAVPEGGAKGTSGSTDTHNLSHSNGMAVAMPLLPKDGTLLGAQQSGPHVVAPYVGRWIPPTNAAEHFVSNCCASHEDWFSQVREERYWLRQLISKQTTLSSQVGAVSGTAQKRHKAAKLHATSSQAEAHLEVAAAAEEALSKPVLLDGSPIPQYTVLRQSAEVGRACILSLIDYCALDSTCFAMVSPTSLVDVPSPGPSVAVVRAGGA